MEDVPADPYALFGRWLAEAEGSELNDPNAVALATADAEGRPSVRMVLFKGWDREGFVFYTNLESRKARELTANPRASLCIFWKSLDRQVTLGGGAEAVGAAEADAYFASRPRTSQIGAWASMQSRPMDGRLDLEKRLAQFAARFGLGPVPRPPHWSGFRIRPTVMEFRQGRPCAVTVRYACGPEGRWRQDQPVP